MKPNCLVVAVAGIGAMLPGCDRPPVSSGPGVPVQPVALNVQPHVQAEWKLPYVPIAIVINSKGEIAVEGRKEIATPIGTFAIGVGYALVPPEESIHVIVIDRQKQTEQVFNVASGANKIAVQIEGKAQLRVEDRRVTVEITEGFPSSVYFKQDTATEPSHKTEERVRFGVWVQTDSKGAIVRAVVPGMPGTRARVGNRTASLEPGDIITKINRRPIRTAREYGAAVDGSPSEMQISVLNHKDGKIYDLTVTLQ